MTTPYEPKDAVPLGADSNQLFRIGIQGPPKTGKTWAALTFPNPIVLDFDNNLRGFSEVYPDKKILAVPFWNATFCDTLGVRCPRPGSPPNQRDALRVWLAKEARNFTPTQTLVLDSWTRLQDGFDKQQELEPSYTKKGEIDEFAFWMKKQEYARDIIEFLNSCNCNIVVTFHETVERDSSGKVTGKMKPMMDGRFADKLAGYFTDWFRQTVMEDDKKERQYLWQVKADNVANCGTSLRKLDLKSIKGFVPANYNSLVQ